MLAEIILLAKNSRLYLYQEKNCWPWHIYRNGDRKNMQPVGVRSKLSMRIRKWNNGTNDINIFEIITNKATLSWPPSVHKNRTKTPTNQTSHIPASISIPVNTPKTIKTCFFTNSTVYQKPYIPKFLYSCFYSANQTYPRNKYVQRPRHESSIPCKVVRYLQR